MIRAASLAVGALLWLIIWVLWIPLWLIGIPLTFLMARSARYSRHFQRWEWTSKWMRVWSTPDNGCCPTWYDVRFHERPLWLNIWIWSAFRNPVGGSTFSATVTPSRIRWIGTSAAPLRAALATGKFQWQLTQHGLVWGLWMIWPLKKRSPTDHFEIRLGWKMVPREDYHTSALARFTPWDVGRRLA